MIWKRRLAIGGAALVALCAIGVGVYFLVGALNKEPKQAVAIALSVARKAGAKIPMKGKK